MAHVIVNERQSPSLQGHLFLSGPDVKVVLLDGCAMTSLKDIGGLNPIPGGSLCKDAKD